MNALTNREIENLGTLLLDATPTNRNLALALLSERYAEVLPQLPQTALFYAFVCPEDEGFRQNVNSVLGADAFERSSWAWLADASQRRYPKAVEHPQLLEVLPLWEAYSAALLRFPLGRQGLIHFCHWACAILPKQPPYFPLIIFLLRQALPIHPKDDIWRQRRFHWHRLLAQLLHQTPPAPLTTDYLNEVNLHYQSAHWLIKNPRLLYRWGQFAEEVFKEPIFAQHLYERGLKNHPDYLDFYLALGRLALETDTLIADQDWAQQTAQLYQQAPEYRQAPLHLVRAFTHWQDNAALQALSYFRKALEWAPHHPLLLETWTLFLKQSEDIHYPMLAIEAYHNALVQVPVEGLIALTEQLLFYKQLQALHLEQDN